MDPTIASVAIPRVAPTWRRVTDLSDPVEIFDPAVPLCTWQREIDPAVVAYLAELEQTGTLQANPGRAALIDDLSRLRELVCELPGCPAFGLRTLVTLDPLWRA